MIYYKPSTEIYEIYKPRLTVGFLNDVISSANSRPWIHCGNCGGYSKVILEVVLTVAYFKFLSWSDILRSYNDVLKMVIVILTWIRLNHIESLRILFEMETLFVAIYTWNIILSTGSKMDSTKNLKSSGNGSKTESRSLHSRALIWHPYI